MSISGFKGIVTSIPTYNEGSFLLFKIKHNENSFPQEILKKIYDDEIFYEELSLSDNIIFENEKRDIKIVSKIRIMQDKNINSNSVLKIGDNFYHVFNIYHFKNSDGFPQSDITLEEYPNPVLEENVC